MSKEETSVEDTPLVVSVPVDLKQKFKAACASGGVTMQDKIIELMHLVSKGKL